MKMFQKGRDEQIALTKRTPLIDPSEFDVEIAMLLQDKALLENPD